MKKLLIIGLFLVFLPCSCAPFFTKTANAETVRKVDILFGGFYSCDQSQVQTAINTYVQWAIDYTLQQQGWSAVYYTHTDGRREFLGLKFNYAKFNLLESQLQIFNETWYTLAIGFGIERDSSTIRYYVVEE